ncbi:MAG: MFS transporter [Clostridia bacterium]|nr:MFS transporter [Clostridia bacterium]
MATIVLVVIYIAFIGLGIPDSLIGSAWPAIYQEFGLPASFVSFVTFLISGCTVISSLFSDRLINRFGTQAITAVSTLMTALAILGFSVSPHFIFLCLLAIPLGLGAGAIDAGLNNYIALHYSASQMSFLHCFYGIGVSCSPYLMSLALSGGAWREGYRTTFWIQIAITAIVVLSLPLWKRVRKTAADGDEPAQRTLPIREQIRDRQIRLMWLVIMATTVIEYVCGTWGTTYLVQARALLPDAAAQILTLYYVGMALGRFLSGILAKKMATWPRIWLGTVVLGVAAVILITPGHVAVSTVALFLVGLGNGSLYPNLIHLTPVNFGADISQSVMGATIAVAYISVMLAPPLFGLVSRFLGVTFFPYFIFLWFVIFSAAALRFARRQKKLGRYDTTV